MKVVTDLRPVSVALDVALRGLKGRDSRICRLSVVFPDIGRQPVLEKIAFLRYPGESSVVKPEATEQELQLQPGLTIHL